MTEQLELYKCNVCGNIVEVIHGGEGDLVCCSVPMNKLTEHNNDEEMQEKHVPVVVIEGENKTIRVGSIPHPMQKEHYVVFIEAISPDKKYLKRKFLFPDDEPKMDINKCSYDKFTARELCNLHGLWVSEYDEEKDK